MSNVVKLKAKTKCPLIPLGDRVIMKRDQLKTLLLIPEDAKQRNAPQRGEVIAKGPECTWPIEIGKTYLHGQYAGAWFNEEGTGTFDPSPGSMFYIVAEEDLIAEVPNV